MSIIVLADSYKIKCAGINILALTISPHMVQAQYKSIILCTQTTVQTLHQAPAAFINESNRTEPDFC